MSRAFTPPDTLSPDDVRTVADVRRALWINGMFGLGAGSVTGMLGHVVLQALQKRYVGDASGSASAEAQAARTAARKATASEAGGFLYKVLRPLPPLGKNTFMLSLLGGGALGSFVLSTTAGKNAVHMLHPIFDLGRDEYAGQSQYQVTMSKAQNDQETNNDATTNSSTANCEGDELDAAHHRTRSLRRKASMKRRLESGQSLSDTHGNTWPEEDTEEMQKDKSMHRAELWGRRQTNRRKTLRDRIVGGKALSDSTGGRWSEEQSEGEK